ncbi:hypothetical protein B0J18DRAFT_460788 [Chaetomium sp. MPI-SDFR-AT-0129]|nr:hypothetical protein B0J18DRAFT_460788 [Chaetomium sp. MPI-SDFR-AT-0129]
MPCDHRGPITLSSALRKNADVIIQAAHLAAAEFCQVLWDCRGTIESLVKHHLCLSDRDSCTVAPRNRWIRGGFNICVPVEIRPGSAHGVRRKFMFRCPMPHKLAEATYPGTVDEKLSCEAGTYAWMQDWCPDVRIPHLYGFGFSDHRSTLSRYAAHPSGLQLPAAYMLLEYIGPDTGRMLSDTWREGRTDKTKQQTLFRGLARLILSLARVPQPRIGSFRFNADSTVTLTNRPLPCCVPILENGGAPRTMPPDETYGRTEPFIADMLALLDGSFLAHRNAVFDAADCRGQMAARALLRTVSHFYLSPERRAGPFHVQMTDVHASNILWICSLPADMISVPYWLTGRGIDQLVGDDLAQFDLVRQAFMEVLEEEESVMAGGGTPTLARIMSESWESGAVWFWHCLKSVDAAFDLVADHVSPKYCPFSCKVEEVLSEYWCQGSAAAAERKVADNEKYERELGSLFQTGDSIR